MASLFVVTYDISEDKIRSEASKLLARYGQRVQYSVFECSLEPKERAELLRECELLVGRSSRGQFRFYRLCAACQDAALGVGDLTPGMGESSWTVI